MWVDFKFVDRGTPVPLKATIKVNPVGNPIELVIKGNTSRMSTVNDSIVIKGNSALVKVNGKSQKQECQA